MPYISASIIFQLLGTVVPSLEKMQKEGEQGRKKIQEWTRYATVPLCIIQAIFWIKYMHSTSPPLVQRAFADSAMFWATGIFSLTAGCIFLMWLGEQIDEYGLGNGVSLIILAGIVARMPQAIMMLIEQTNFTPGVAAATRASPSARSSSSSPASFSSSPAPSSSPRRNAASPSSRPSTRAGVRCTAARGSTCRCA
jgi:preprotein translocase subunit SecY